jgi:hypothetical protein
MSLSKYARLDTCVEFFHQPVIPAVFFHKFQCDRHQQTLSKKHDYDQSKIPEGINMRLTPPHTQEVMKQKDIHGMFAEKTENNRDHPDIFPETDP